MLVLSRKPGEKLIIADEITVSVLSVQGNRVRLGINAPGCYRVLRAELTNWNDSHAEIPAEKVAPAPLPIPVGTVSEEPAWSI